MLCLLAIPARAQQQEIQHYSVGTGFFISKEGYLLTSAHVIEKCTQYIAYGQNSIMQSTLVARNEEHDLALLKTETPVDWAGHFYAPETPPQIGSTLITIGYPAETWRKRKPAIGTAKLLEMQGPEGEESLLQFSDSVSQGNSGGPLLDRAGNIVGVVTSKKILTETNALTNEVISVRKVDAAINAETVKDFLEENDLEFPVADSSVMLSRASIAEKAKAYIVSIRCKVD
jgi:serine protease Do